MVKKTIQKEEPIVFQPQELTNAFKPKPDRKKKIRSRVLILFDVLIIGALAITAAVFYRDHTRTQALEQLQKQTVQFKQSQFFDVKVPLAVNALEYSPNRISGRLIKNSIESAIDARDAMASSFVLAKKELKVDESIVTNPIKQTNIQSQKDFPAYYEWLAYSKKEAIQIFTTEVGKISKISQNNISYALGGIEVTEVETTADSEIFYLHAKVEVYTNEPIQ